jgi:imidazolonepropionase-like amidohydrolase
MKLLSLAIASILPLGAQSGAFTIHMILHAIGEEHYEIKPAPGGLVLLNTTFEYSDRGNKRSTSATFLSRPDFTPVSLEVKGQTSTVTARVGEGMATVDENGSKRAFTPPQKYFAIFGTSPFALQMAMLHYWNAHGRPANLPVLRASADADAIRIEPVGQDTIAVGGHSVTLNRLTIANVMFGREVVWTDAKGDLAAAMTFAGGLPMEAVRTEYEQALPQLYRSGVAQELANLAAIGRQVPAERTGAFAIVGATLVDATGAPPVKDSVVIVHNGRIAAVGSRNEVRVPPGMAVVDAKGQTLLPGLWEMHTHFSGVEFGPALLAAGITTARDCGGEFDFLVAQRDAAEKGAVSPRLLLAGLVDAGGPKAFGHVTAETPEQGRAVVARYHAAGFQQIKLYTFLEPDVIRAITAEAHRLNMTVTGHVPQALNAFEGVEAGMDQINHLNYVSKMMREAGEQKAVQFFKDHHTVVDPTAGWGEMAGHSKEVDVAEFEPGILKAPFIVSAKYRGMGNGTRQARADAMAQNLAAIGALHKAGIAIVPGSDTGLVGYGLDREIELYVQAGMTPMEAIQSATIVSARAMNLDRDSGTIETGKRADLILVDGNPLADIRDLRKVSRVVANGRLYDSGKLWKSAGFTP